MTSYVVRVYRRGDTEEEIVGTVATPGREGRMQFHNFQELKAILLQDDSDEAPHSRSSGYPKEEK